MAKRRHGWARIALGAAALAAGAPAAAQSFSANYVFGDSLSDQGNLAEALGHNFPSPPFAYDPVTNTYGDSFTDGPVAVQVLAQRLGLPASNPSLYSTGFSDAHGLGLTPGTNYAVAGSTAGNLAGVPGGNLGTQVGAYLLHSAGQAQSDALYTIFIGGNDVRTAAHSADAATASSFLAAGVQAELDALNALYAAGARNFLVVNVPDIGVIPEFTLGYPDQVATATADAIAYNKGLTGDVGQFLGISPGAKVTLFDLYGFGKTLDLAALGITNTTQPCYVSYGGVTDTRPLVVNPACGAIDPATGQAANVDKFAYWDPIHPTRPVQDAIGNALADAVIAGSVPEPATWATAILGFGLAGAFARGRRGRPAGRTAAA